MDTLFGLPAHPLLVHIPIVLLPLAAIGVVVMLIRPAWHRRYRWVVLGMGIAGALGATLAAQAGEELENRIVAVEGREAAASWEHHANLGETARNFALLFMFVLIVFVFVPWWLERRASRSASLIESAAAANRNMRVLTIAVSALVVLAAVGTVVTIVQAGHTGSESVWEDYVKDTGG
jgi:glycine/D-amino acid oxidase-like deaminating enzyme